MQRQRFTVAFVAQNGIEQTVIPWDEFDCLFVGGDNAFKLAESTYALVREAKQRGKWCHMGRVNSLRRLRAARVGGYDSVDGTMLAFDPTGRYDELVAWMAEVEAQPVLKGLR
jgi:hypothetical protein